jgi:hypothetical protein
VLRLAECKDATTVFQEYKQWLADRHYNDKGLAISHTVLQEDFWEKVQQVVDICGHIIEVLRLANGTVPSTGKLYWKIY